MSFALRLRKAQEDAPKDATRPSQGPTGPSVVDVRHRQYDSLDRQLAHAHGERDPTALMQAGRAEATAYADLRLIVADLERRFGASMPEVHQWIHDRKMARVNSRKMIEEATVNLSRTVPVAENGFAEAVKQMKESK